MVGSRLTIWSCRDYLSCLLLFLFFCKMKQGGQRRGCGCVDAAPCGLWPGWKGRKPGSPGGPLPWTVSNTHASSARAHTLPEWIESINERLTLQIWWADDVNCFHLPSQAPQSFQGKSEHIQTHIKHAARSLSLPFFLLLYQWLAGAEIDRRTETSAWTHGWRITAWYSI